MRISLPLASELEVQTGYEDKYHEVIQGYTSAADAVSSGIVFEGKRMNFLLTGDEDAHELVEVQQALEDNVGFIVNQIDVDLIELGLNIIPGPFLAATTLNQVAMYAQLGVKEMYVTGSLAMDLDALKPVKELYGLTIRVVADIVQTDVGFDNMPKKIASKTFWLRPEALVRVEDVIDTIEVMSTNKLVYYADRVSPPNLDLLIEGLLPFTKNEEYRPMIDGLRRVCRMKCHLGHPCDVCRNGGFKYED